MGAIGSALGSFFGWLFSPITFIFHWVFFLPVFNVLMLIYQGIHSFGFSIILLTLLIRACLIPLTRKQLESTRKMQAIQPQLRALQAQYRGDQQGMIQAQQELYKENGVSMMGLGGCLPLLIQMPFLYALYYSFYSVLGASGDVLKTINGYIYPFLPQLTHVPSPYFFGMSLIQPSPVLAILAGLLTFIQMRMAMPVTAPTGNAQADQTASMQRNMMYIMPLVTVFIGWKYYAGLALYWCFSTGFSAAQQYFLSGWGSLWVGVPGMEHLVPAPKTTVTPVTPTPSSSRRAIGSANVVEAPTAPASGGGLFANLRESWRRLQEQALSQAEARHAGINPENVVDADSAVADASDASDANKNVETEAAASDATKATPTGARRARTKAAAVTLVRPVASAGSAPQNDELPEKRIARDAGGANGSANGSKNNGTNGSSRAAYASAGSGASGKRGGQNGARNGQQGARNNRNRGSR